MRKIISIILVGLLSVIILTSCDSKSKAGSAQVAEYISADAPDKAIAVLEEMKTEQTVVRPDEIVLVLKEMLIANDITSYKDLSDEIFVRYHLYHEILAFLPSSESGNDAILSEYVDGVLALEEDHVKFLPLHTLITSEDFANFSDIMTTYDLKVSTLTDQAEIVSYYETISAETIAAIDHVDFAKFGALNFGIQNFITFKEEIKKAVLTRLEAIKTMDIAMYESAQTEFDTAAANFHAFSAQFVAGMNEFENMIDALPDLTQIP